MPQLTIKELRSIFAKCCKILGLDQETCVALILMLPSEEELGTIIRWMWKHEKEHPSTTEVVQIAENIKDYYLEKQKK